MDFSPFIFLFIRVPGLWHELWDLESSMISIEPQALLTIILFKNVTFQELRIKLFNTSTHPNFVPLFLCQPTGFCIHKILPKKEKKHSGWVLKKNLICLHFDAFPQRIWEGYNVEIILFIIITCISFFILFLRGHLNLPIQVVNLWSFSDSLHHLTPISESRLRNPEECLYPLTPKIWLLILPSSCYTLPFKSVTRIWC